MTCSTCAHTYYVYTYFLFGSQDRSAKTVIPLLHMNVVLNGPGLESHPNSMLIAFWDEKCKKTRHIFVYAEVGKVYRVATCIYNNYSTHVQVCHILMKPVLLCGMYLSPYNCAPSHTHMHVHIAMCWRVCSGQ